VRAGSACAMDCDGLGVESKPDHSIRSATHRERNQLGSPRAGVAPAPTSFNFRQLISPTSPLTPARSGLRNANPRSPCPCETTSTNSGTIPCKCRKQG